MEEISDSELREKLLKFGIDVPVAAGKEFLLRKLKRLEDEKSVVRRRSTPPVQSTRPPAEGQASASKKSRLSLNESALRQTNERSSGSNSRSATNAAGVNNSTNNVTRSRSNRPNVARQSLPVQPRNNNVLRTLVEENNHFNDNDDDNEDEEDDDEMELDEEDEEEERVGNHDDNESGSSPNFEFGNSSSHNSNNHHGHHGASSRQSSETSSTNFNFGYKFPSRKSEGVSIPPPAIPASQLIHRGRKSTPVLPSTPASSATPTPRSTLVSPNSFDSNSRGSAEVSPRYQSYLEYFKRPSDQPTSPLVLPRSQYTSPTGSPFSTAANAGTPYRSSFNLDDSFGNDTAEDDDEEEEEEEIEKENKLKKIFSKFNPINWTLFTSGGGNGKLQDVPGPDRQTDRSYSLGMPGKFPPSPPSRYPSSPTSNSNSSSTGINGHWSPNRSRLANQISPVSQQPPPTVPPAVAAGRQAGFKAFFSRGERNGYGYSTGRPGTTDSSHLISKILFLAFIMMFVGIMGLYYYKTTASQGNGLDTEKTDFFYGFSGSNTDNEKEGGVANAAQSNVVKPKPVPVKTELVYPICGVDSYKPDACVLKSQIKNSKVLFDALRNRLIQRAKLKGCETDIQEKITLASAKNLLYDLVGLSKSEVDSSFQGMLMLVTENPTFGMKIENENFEDIAIKDTLSLDQERATIFVQGVSPDFLCILYGGIVSLVSYCIFFAFLSGIGYVCYKALVYHWGRKEREEREMFEHVETILKMLHEHYESSKTLGGDAFLARDHVRDELFPPRDRKKKDALWRKIVDHISTQESRVREEIQHVSGEEFRVWRWLPSASPLMTKRHQSLSSVSGGSTPAASPKSKAGLYPKLSEFDLDNSGIGSSLNDKWQGQAFEMTEGSPNSLHLTPTTCLKIRHLYNKDQDSEETGNSKIERAILGKCSQSRILHIGIDRDSREDCVYVRCQTKDDARNAYSALHGWWFDGKLLAVKFLREDRYFTRFPNAKYRTIPLTMANLSSPKI